MSIKRRKFLKSTLALSAPILTTGCDIGISQQHTQQPNVLLFLADDQRNDTLGCTGHSVVKTPNIDNLANTGCLFENTFVTTAICAASRASIFTGLYERIHRYTFKTEPLSSRFAEHSYPKILKDNGFYTGFIGKFGIKSSIDFVPENFDYFKNIDRSPYFHKLPNRKTEHETDAAVYYAKEFISTAVQTQKPFCLSISFNAPHAAESHETDVPFPGSKSVAGMYDSTEMPLPKLRDKTLFSELPDFLKNSLNRKRFFWRWNDSAEYQRNMRGYLSMISGIDNAVGEVMAFLEENDALENTIVIYSADNGYYMGDRGFAGKWSHFDQSLRIPLIIRDPRAPEEQQGKRITKMALNIDLCPTILDFAKIESLQQHSGESLKHWVTGEDKRIEWRTAFLCEHLMEHDEIAKWEGVRRERYSYARYFEQSPAYEFLYDLVDDPDQSRNLAFKPDYANILIELSLQCDSLIDSCDALRNSL